MSMSMMSNPEVRKQLHVTNINAKPQLYVDGLVILDNIKSVLYQESIYICRDNTIATSTGRKTVLSLVQRGETVYYLS
ncbi:hypothetical protein D9M71_430990 [compost metagenome]